MIVNCDRCNTDFEINFLREDFGDFKRLFFMCPNCKKEYTVSFENQKMKQIKEQINEMKTKLSMCDDKKCCIGYIKNINKKVKQMQSINNLLEKRYLKMLNGEE